MRIIAFILDPPVIERILTHIGIPSESPALRPARSPPQGELRFDQTAGLDYWPEMDRPRGSARGGIEFVTDPAEAVADLKQSSGWSGVSGGSAKRRLGS